ncbi:WD40 repeat-containing protein [Cavenderia fasciculata]|uniref:Ribosome biogenesis protein BOP1 homolog n=1 Tax=Cavenderia fasciculata TaxID=261658 RepID=F4Q248_CACFS|nr:WD40 repeat-containing protein [Cavenderia fasciculata]EGG18068.1 WD40 repeat-containing protein [Cavenderia fasciculata]|eukprot:XP_004356961.1 WD40 repeat-containing protein [Cavenderia fasciculata]
MSTRKPTKSTTTTPAAVAATVAPIAKKPQFAKNSKNVVLEEEPTVVVKKPTTTTTAPTKNILGKRREQEVVEKVVEEELFEDDSSDEIEEGDDEDDGSIDEQDDEDDEDNLTTGSISTYGEQDSSEDDDDESEEENIEDLDDDDGISGEIPSKYSNDPNQFYDEDNSSEDESLVNRIGNVPLHWYDDYDHIGYDVDGNKIMKGEQKDSLDKFIDQSDPNFWRTVHDKVNGKQVILTDEELATIKSIQRRQFPAGFDPYKDWYDPGPNPDSIHPLSAAPTPKRSFLGDINDERKIRKLTIAIRKGWIKIPDTSNEEKTDQDDEIKRTKAYDLWAPKTEQEVEEDELLQRTNRRISRIPAPKTKLPGNVESFNPPEEYLLTSRELKAWHMMSPARRPHNFVPQKFNTMSDIPSYNRSIREKFERCLDLYLCPRVTNIKKKPTDVSHLLPKLPKPQDLRPFPTHEEHQFNGHKGRVRSISVSPNGQFLVSCAEDHTVKIWEVKSTRCLFTLQLDDTVSCVAWNPNKSLNIIAVAYENKVVMITPKLYGPVQNEETEAMFPKTPIPPDQKVRWYQLNKDNGIRVEVEFEFKIKQISWHYKGDYFSTISPDDKSKSVRIHQLSKRKSQAPFKRSKTPYQVSKFHPSKPIFFIADQNIVKVYDLSKQQLIKKVTIGSRWISSLDVHPSGDHILVGGYDKKVFWFDLDMANVYKVLKYHSKAVRRVVYHPTLPLFSSCSDDLSIQIFHGTVYSDYLQNALIVPLKVLKKHTASSDGLGVLDIVFHPTQAWIFSAGADSTIRLFV